MGDPVALYVRYLPGHDPIREAIENEQLNYPNKNLRVIIESWLKDREQLQIQLNSQKELIDKLDLLLDIHNSYIIEKNMFAVYPRSLKTSDMIRALEDDHTRHSKRVNEKDEEP